MTSPPSILDALADTEPARVERAAARTSWPPHTDPATIPPGFHARGTSTLRRGDGSIALVWQKTSVDRESQHQAMLDAFASVGASIPAAGRTKRDRGAVDDDLLAVYPMGDPHLGLHAWADETGDRHFDLKIATHELVAAATELVDRMPRAATALVVPLGDFFHSDNMQNRTSRSGHALDVDGRYGKIAQTGVATMIAIIEAAKRRHALVIVRIEIGNHDDQSSQWLALCLAQRYHNDPRVVIDLDAMSCKFWYYEFGNTLIGTTHGDTVARTGPTLAEVMAHDRREAWGRVRWGWWLVGHVHNKSVHERPGVVIETHRTMAPRDGWAAAGGYRSGQGMHAVLVHRVYGEHRRELVSQFEIASRYESATRPKSRKRGAAKK